MKVKRNFNDKPTGSSLILSKREGHWVSLIVMKTRHDIKLISSNSLLKCFN